MDMKLHVHNSIIIILNLLIMRFIAYTKYCDYERMHGRKISQMILLYLPPFPLPPNSKISSRTVANIPVSIIFESVEPTEDSEGSAEIPGDVSYSRLVGKVNSEALDMGGSMGKEYGGI